MRSTFGYHFAMIVIAIGLVLSLVACAPPETPEQRYVELIREVDFAFPGVEAGMTDEDILHTGEVYCQLTNEVSDEEMVFTLRGLGLDATQILLMGQSADEAMLC